MPANHTRVSFPALKTGHITCIYMELRIMASVEHIDALTCNLQLPMLLAGHNINVLSIALILVRLLTALGSIEDFYKLVRDLVQH